MTSFLQIGDWVSGTSIEDERVFGYIEEIHDDAGLVAVRVMKSDRPEAVGQKLRSRKQRVKKLPAHVPTTEGELMNLIDLALATHDQKWFEELVNKLQQVQKKHKATDSDSLSSIPYQRWNQYRIR